MISNNLRKRFYTSLILLGIVFLIFHFNFILVYSLIILGVLSILEFLKLTQKLDLSKLNRNLINLVFISYISFFCFIFFLFSNIIVFKILLYIMLFGCVASDIGGFIFGKVLKGPKLTKISPNKTYAGSAGSILFTLIIVSLLFNYFLNTFNYKIILVALTVSIFCQIGDLVFSFLKRKVKLKDSSNFLPGHGGILDRLDGVFFGVPAGFLILILLN